MYIYESHMGGLYVSEFELDDLYCEQCGDSDTYIGEAYTLEEASKLLKDNDYCEMYVPDYIDEFLSEHFTESEGKS